MSNSKLNGTETEVTTAEFNRYFNENYPYVSHSLSNKQVEKWLNQDVIKRVSLSKKADYFQDYILSQGLEDDVQLMEGGVLIDDEADISSPYSVQFSSTASAPVGAQLFMAGGNVNAIEKKVAEVNELIEIGNNNNVSVTDTSSTWQAPMKYKPFVYKNGVLYENYEELDLYHLSKKGENKWREIKNKYTKSADGIDVQKSILNDVAKMYRKELKYYADYDNYLLRAKGKMMAGGKTNESRGLFEAEWQTKKVEKKMENNLLEAIENNSGSYFIPKGSELIDIEGTIHTTEIDQTITKENYRVATDKGVFIPKTFVYLNINKFMAGGSIDNENKLMVANNNKQLRHHTEELENALQNAKHIPAWVVSLVGRATQDISDVTHYLDGTTQYKNGGSIEGKTNQEIADMYWQMSEDLEEEIQKDRGSETGGLNIERQQKLEDDMYRYYELSVEYQKLADDEKEFKKNGGVRFIYDIGGL